MTSRLDGIDVSRYQGKIDWPAVAEAGIFWAATKATQGTSYVDPTLTANRAGMANADIRYRQLYHWLNPAIGAARLVPALRKRDAYAQADFFLKTVGKLSPGEGVLLDAEQTGIRSDQVAWWCERVEATTGLPVEVYTGVYVAGGEIWKSATVFNGKRARVLAAYISEERMLKASAPWRPDCWQFTSTATVPGVPTPVDGDMIYNRARFDAACGLVKPPVKPVTVAKPVERRRVMLKGTLNVALLQQQLKQLGLYAAKVDGKFWKVTEAGVRMFQAQHRLSVTGVYDKFTADKMSAVLTEKAAKK